MEPQVITIPAFDGRKRNKLLSECADQVYDLSETEKRLADIGLGDEELSNVLRKIHDRVFNSARIDCQNEIKKRTEMHSQLIGKFWKVSNNKNETESVIFPYEMSEKGPVRVSMLQCVLSQQNYGYSTGISTQHYDMNDDLWMRELTFTEITEEEFKKTVHDDVDSVIGYRKYRLEHSKPGYKCTWSDKSSSK